MMNETTTGCYTYTADGRRVEIFPPENAKGNQAETPVCRGRPDDAVCKMPNHGFFCSFSDGTCLRFADKANTGIPGFKAGIRYDCFGEPRLRKKYWTCSVVAGMCICASRECGFYKPERQYRRDRGKYLRAENNYRRARRLPPVTEESL
jgi:hypothetical protein